MSYFRSLLLLGIAGSALAAMGFAADRYEVRTEQGVEVRMRDGVVLRADIYRPKADGKFPVLLTRTPYDKQGESDIGIAGATRGYVVIAQDVRGRYSSEGDWYPFTCESADGYDTVEWAAALPYSNGKVGMFGGSYVGATQLLAAIAHPPHLAGIFPAYTASNYHDGWTYQGGAFEQWFNESWTTGLALDTLSRQVRKNINTLSWAEKLPLASFPVEKLVPAEGLAPYFYDWLAHPAYDNFWKQWSIEDHYNQINVPVFHVGAWYDIFLGGTLRNYVGLKASADGDAARKGQYLLIGIGGHAGHQAKIGDVDFGAQSQFKGDEIMLGWYDSLLKNVPGGTGQEKPVKIFVMGKNVWREESEWPVARARNTRYYLRSAGNANSMLGTGSLSPQAPTAQTASDKFTYDPQNPVPTRGGPLCCDRTRLGAGPVDQLPVEARNDVLVYTTPAFQTDFEVTGPLRLELYVSSSAVDTDFTAKLVDVWPNGFAQNLAEGILRMRYRNTPEHAEMMNPGETYKITIDLTATSNVFLAGHKLRLEVSSSNFPRFDRNLNTGEEAARAVQLVKATNIVLHDREHPSALILPVVPQ